MRGNAQTYAPIALVPAGAGVIFFLTRSVLWATGGGIAGAIAAVVLMNRASGKLQGAQFQDLGPTDTTPPPYTGPPAYTPPTSKPSSTDTGSGAGDITNSTAKSTASDLAKTLGKGKFIDAPSEDPDHARGYGNGNTDGVSREWGQTMDKTAYFGGSAEYKNGYDSGWINTGGNPSKIGTPSDW